MFPSHKQLGTSLLFAWMSFTSLANIGIDANEIESISHFRTFTPPVLEVVNDVTFVNGTVEDKQGYLWIKDRGNRLLKYDGYSLVNAQLKTKEVSVKWRTLALHVTDDKEFWVGNAFLHKYNYDAQAFETYEPFTNGHINSLVSDKNDDLWGAGTAIGIVAFDTQNASILKQVFPANLPSTITKIVYESTTHRLWMLSEKGLFNFDIAQEKLEKVLTPIDDYYQSFWADDITIDTVNNHLWIASPYGLVRLDTITNDAQFMTQANGWPSLLSDDTSATFIDSNNNLWVGAEKNGLCLYRDKRDDFVCLKSAEVGDNALPVTSIEHIFESSDGRLWISTNKKGFVSITPSLEKFSSIEQRLSEKRIDYFRNTFDAVLRDNGDVWLATDGGGIQIFNHLTGSLRILQRQKDNPNSLSSNSTIAITEDTSGNIWIGTWAGGITKVEPSTMSFTRFIHQPKRSPSESLRANNIFDLYFSDDETLWISVWDHGLQKLNTATNEFTMYSAVDENPIIKNRHITQIRMHNDFIWVVGGSGLEKFNPKTEEPSEMVFFPMDTFYTSLEIVNAETFLVGTIDGLFIYNPITNASELYSFSSSNDSNENEESYRIHYIHRENENDVWLGTNKGIIYFNLQTRDFTKYTTRDGIVDNLTSLHGDVFKIKGELFFPTTGGVAIIDPHDLPKKQNASETVIRSVTTIKTDSHRHTALDNQNHSHEFNLNSEQNQKLSYSDNSLVFKFSSLNLHQPQQNMFKFRLLGFQNDFEYSNAGSREARFTNLTPGDYVFEVYSANAFDIWDERGASFAFTILKPWWQTWWARLLFLVTLLLLVITVFRWRDHLARSRQAVLEEMVDNKTKELQKTSAELADVNSKLEQRVAERTEALQLEVNERKSAEKRLYHLAFHDSLTGLPNREWLVKKLEAMLSICRKNNANTCALMFLDGDRFKIINDTYGHSVGDELLVVSANRLNAMLDSGMHATRLGGDEFTVLIERLDNQSKAEQLAQRIVEGFKEPFVLGKTTLHFNVSIGVVTFNSEYTEVTDILRDADIAMYHAKESGKGVYKLYDSAMHQAIMETAQLEADIRKAIDNDGFHLVYQPIIDLRSKQVKGFEALIRWDHAIRGFIPPDKFIPLAEETGLIVDIGKWVLRKACSQFRQWQLFDGFDDVTISINLSSRQLQDGQFLDVLDSTLNETGLQGKHIKLELTETALIEHTETIGDLLENVRKRGVELAIDDFGTGYSSLSYLSQLPVQNIKIDRKFVDALTEADCSVNADALEIVKAAITLGQSVRMEVTAEGIETLQQMMILMEHGCDYAQGYFIAKPLKETDVVEFVDLHFIEFLKQIDL